MRKLNVWMAGRHVATITESRRRMTLAYARDVGQFGMPLISVAMPIASTAYTDKVVRPYFHGLLPEGQARLIIAYDFGLDATDDAGLLEALGRDCAGALVILPDDETPSGVDTRQPLEQLDEHEIELRLKALPVHPLGVTTRIRASLPGVQSKLLLTARDGQWCSPDATHPSTHILKPGIAELADSVVNEVFCMNVATRSGLRAATTTTARFGETTILVSQRYDRREESDGVTARLHQEDACQALSIMTTHPREKYQSHGGPTLRRIADVLTQWRGSTTELLEQITFSTLVGNADLHGKNVSFLHYSDGTVGLTPMYDVMCTTHYDGTKGLAAVDTELGLFIGRQTDILRVGIDDVVDEATSWGMRASTARATITELIERVEAAIIQTRDDSEIDVPESIVDRITKRTRDFTLVKPLPAVKPS